MTRQEISDLVTNTSPADLFALNQAINEDVLNALRYNIEGAWENAITTPFESLRSIELITLFEDMILRGRIVTTDDGEREVEVVLPIATACDPDLRKEFFDNLKIKCDKERSEKEEKIDAAKLSEKIELFNSLKKELGKLAE
jgi:hypothetical protein